MKDATIITIDGPSGSGKGSLALGVAKFLKFHLLDSGAIYRLAALKALQTGVDLQQEQVVNEAIQKMDINFKLGNELTIPYLDGIDVADKIRLETTGEAASIIAAYSSVRKTLLSRQQDYVQPPGLVADGRDMGTVVFPQAKIKIYLHASNEERAKRRYKQLIDMGKSANIPRLQSDIAARDERDSNRAESPLKPAQDAIVVDSSTMDQQQVLELVLSHINDVNK